jgi:Calcineurin-like phosphoesterase
MADIHGNEVALRAVLDDAASCRVDRWWVLGDLVLLGPRPAEVLELLRSLPDIEMLRGNTDRYVLTGEQPAPHATAADAAGSTELVERYGLMAAGIGWTRGVLCQAGLLGALADLRPELRVRLPDGTSVLGVHALPGADDGPGIEPPRVVSPRVVSPRVVSPRVVSPRVVSSCLVSSRVAPSRSPTLASACSGQRGTPPWPARPAARSLSARAAASG